MIDPPEVAKPPEPKPLRIFYPVLFAVFPVLSIYSANLSLVPYQMMFRPLGLTIVVTAALWGVLSLIFRNTARGAISATVLVSMTLAFSRTQALARFVYIPMDYDLWFWGILTVIALIVFTWKWRWHKVLNVLSFWMVVAALAQVGYGMYQASSLIASKKYEATSATMSSKDQPDIIYIILDGYGRSDALKRALDFSNDSFIDGLEERGFYVAKDSRANYCQTELSLASSLNMNYIPEVLPKVTSKDEDRAPLTDIVDKNAAADYLRRKGYVFAAITSRFPPIQFESADLNMRTLSGVTLIESALIQMTPLALNASTLTSLMDERRNTMLNEFDALGALGTKNARPRFVAVHILAPHPPFVFGPNGEHLARKGPFGYWDGSDFMDHIGTPEEYRKGYAGQATFVGKRMLDALDKILAGSGPKPVIIIQGDHGSKLRLDQGALARTDVNECFPNLNAYFVPDSVRKNLYPGVTPVNSFRLLFNGLFEDNLELLPDRSFYSTFPKPYDVTEVTDKVVGPEKMASVPVPDFGPRPPQGQIEAPAESR